MVGPVGTVPRPVSYPGLAPADRPVTRSHPAPRGSLSLVHGDLHLRKYRGCRRLAATSWRRWTGNCRRWGDPIADLGTTLAYWPEQDELILPEFRALLPGRLSAPGRSGRTGYCVRDRP